MGEPAIDYDLLADMVAERLAARIPTAPPKYASAKNNPLSSERAFLDAHRAGRFQTFKNGREVLAKWEDVERYLESRQTTLRAERDDDEQLLAAAAPGARRAKRTR